MGRSESLATRLIYMVEYRLSGTYNTVQYVPPFGHRLSRKWSVGIMDMDFKDFK